jgi:hypothetical protein
MIRDRGERVYDSKFPKERRTPAIPRDVSGREARDGPADPRRSCKPLSLPICRQYQVSVLSRFFEVALLSFGGCGVVNRLLPYA